MSRFEDILGTVGRTPVVRLNRLAPPGVSMHVKLEAANPMGSVKDRLAVGLLEAAAASGELKPGQTVIEATSGNTGIGLAMVCAVKGHPLVVVMAENFSLERRRILRFLGAKVVLTPAQHRGTGMMEKARELAEAHGWYLCRQFDNEAGPEVHARTTAREILDDFHDEPLDWFVTGYGTGGTLKGIARVLRKESPGTKILVAEPDTSQVLASGLRQERLADGRPASSHPAFSPHPIQGWGPDFVPGLLEGAEGLHDEFAAVDGDDAIAVCRDLAVKEGIFSGLSGGATLAAALRLAERVPAGTRILAMLPDTGERYQSTPLFEGVPVEMTPEEQEIAASTPGFRFDAAPAAQPPEVAAPTELDSDADALALIDAALRDSSQPVVLFALTWCEFCWSIRRLFKQAGVDYRSIDLDSPELQADGLGARARRALHARTGSSTVPQVFVGGELLGGCSDTLAAWADGRLPARLGELGVAFDAEAAIEPETLLPGWVHPRR